MISENIFIKKRILDKKEILTKRCACKIKIVQEFHIKL